MIIVDTGPLVGLIDPRDSKHDSSRSELTDLVRQGESLYVTIPVLTETFVFLRPAIARRKLIALLGRFRVEIQDVSPVQVDMAFRWLDAYADHDPDFADAVIVIVSYLNPTARVWTYDSEFRTIWRKPDGSAIPLALGAPRRSR